MGYTLPVDLRFDLWHLAFVNLIQSRAPPNFVITDGVTGPSETSNCG